MFSSTALIVLAIIGTNCVLFLGFMLIVRQRVQHEKKNIFAISSAISEYFLKSGVGVAVGCTKLLDHKRYTAFIESEPMKRFRLSHIIEIALCDHVMAVCGLELEKVYWRFPIKEVHQDQGTPGQPQISEIPASPDAPQETASAADEYINEGLIYMRDTSEYEIMDSSLEKFEEAINRVKSKENNLNGGGTAQ